MLAGFADADGVALVVDLDEVADADAGTTSVSVGNVIAAGEGLLPQPLDAADVLGIDTETVPPLVVEACCCVEGMAGPPRAQDPWMAPPPPPPASSFFLEPLLFLIITAFFISFFLPGRDSKNGLGDFCELFKLWFFKVCFNRSEAS